MIVPDGAADEPIEALGGKTPLQAAHIPGMDALATEGVVGALQTVPEGMEPGSDVACMSIIGYDPARFYTGRAPLELASRGMTLGDGQTAWRCNLIHVTGDVLEDFSGGHITTEDARPLIDIIQSALGRSGTRFYAGVGYRHLMVTDALAGADAKTEPPHNIMGEKWRDYLPGGEGTDFLVDLMTASRELLPDSDVNRKREAEGKPSANMIWLWGGGTRPHLPAFRDRYGVRGAVVTAVDLVAGIGNLIGWDRMPVEGATAYFDTNYAGKAQAALDALEDHDFVFVHIEAPDEAGHEGSVERKVEALERIDSLIVKPLLDHARATGDMRILLLPDHPTPVRLRTHTCGSVPFALWGPGIERSGTAAYDEPHAAAGLRPPSGEHLIRLLLNGIGVTS